MNKVRKANGFIEKTLGKYMLSNVAAYFFGCLSVAVTGIMVGLLVDTDGLAAVSLCLPVYYFFAAVGTLIHSGASTFAASRVGRDDASGANRFYTLAFAASAVCGVVIMISGLVFCDRIAYFLGARGELIPVTRDYLKILLIGAPASMFVYFPINFLRLTSRPALAPVCYIVQTLPSIALTYVFIVFFDMGAPGAALAGVISNYLLAAVGIFFVVKYADFSFVRIKKCGAEIVSMIKAGSVISLDSVGCLVRILILNIIAYRVGGTGGVCIIGVVSAISEFCAAFLLGAPQSTVPLIAIFSSEHDTVSVRHTVKSSLRFGIITIVIFSSLLAIFAPQTASLFGLSDPSLNSLAAAAIRIFSSSLVFGLATCVLTTLYITTGRSVIANIAAIMRSALLVIPAALILASLSDSVVILSLCFPAAEILTLLITLAAAFVISRKSNRYSGILLLDDRVEKSGKIAAYSVKNDADSIVAASEGVSEFCDNNSISPKRSMALSLAVEEMLVSIGDKCLDKNPDEIIDVRLFCLENITGLRIRNGGRRFNILRYAEDNPGDIDCLGINMIKKMADVIEYRNTFDANNLLIILK